MSYDAGDFSGGWGEWVDTHERWVILVYLWTILNGGRDACISAGVEV